MRKLITVSVYSPGSEMVAVCNQPAVCQNFAGKCRRLASEACLQLPRDVPTEGSGGKLFAIYGSRLGVLYVLHGDDLQVQWFCCFRDTFSGFLTSTQDEMNCRRTAVGAGKPASNCCKKSLEIREITEREERKEKCC
jgi:hypothetical protein